MDSIQEMKGASIVVDTCAAIEAGEDVLVVTDWQVADVAERVAAAANERDANVTMTMMDPREYDGNEPEDTVAAAMMEADVIITPVHRSITHSSATAEAKENGARVISMVKFTDEQLIRGGLYADYEGMRPHCEEMARKFSEASEARVTSPQGTDVTVDLEGRDGNSHPDRGRSGRVHRAGAHRGEHLSGRGRHQRDRRLRRCDPEPRYRRPRGAGSDGDRRRRGHLGRRGKEAKKIARVWAEHDDPAVYNIAQLAVGMNPECPDFNGWFSNDHGRYGNVHFGSAPAATSAAPPVHPFTSTR